MGVDATALTVILSAIRDVVVAEAIIVAGNEKDEVMNAQDCPTSMLDINAIASNAADDDEALIMATGLFIFD